jgi:hypothetical protein
MQIERRLLDFFRDKSVTEALRPAIADGLRFRQRRIVALVFDLIFVSVLSCALWLALAVLTLGLSLFILPLLRSCHFLQRPHRPRMRLTDGGALPREL